MMSVSQIPSIVRHTLRTTARTHISSAGIPTSRYMSNGSTRHGNDPEILEKGKQDSLRKQRKDSTEAPHWHEEIASDSEAFVKAQRDEMDASSDAIAKLQNQTKGAAEAQNK